MNKKIKHFNLTAFFVGLLLSALSCVPKVNDASIKSINEALVPENSNINTDSSSIIPAEAGIQEDGEEIDTSNWKTYRNEEHGFEFKYPENYEITESKRATWITVNLYDSNNDKVFYVSNLPVGFENASLLDEVTIDDIIFNRGSTKTEDGVTHYILPDNSEVDEYFVYSFETVEELELFQNILYNFNFF